MHLCLALCHYEWRRAVRHSNQGQNLEGSDSWSESSCPCIRSSVADSRDRICWRTSVVRRPAMADRQRQRCRRSVWTCHGRWHHTARQRMMQATVYCWDDLKHKNQEHWWSLWACKTKGFIHFVEHNIPWHFQDNSSAIKMRHRCRTPLFWGYHAWIHFIMNYSLWHMRVRLNQSCKVNFIHIF